MADVFISYAKTDRPLALKLAAMLEAEGWKVWWDTSLTIGNDFRNEIMTELGRARAVVVIWTDASIKPQIIIVAFATNRLHAAVTVLLMLIFFTIIALVQIPMDAIHVVAVSAFLTWFIPVLLLSVA